MTFAKERAPSPEDNPEHDSNADMAYWLPLPMWLTKEVLHKKVDWSRPREEAGTILDEGDVDLKCPLPLRPHLQELLGGEEPSLVGAKVEDRLPPPPIFTSLPPPSTPEDLEPTPCMPQIGSSGEQGM